MQKRSLKPLATLVTLAAWAGVANAATIHNSVSERADAVVEVLLEDQLSEWSLAGPAHLADRAAIKLEATGKLVLTQEEIIGGNLSVEGEGLRLFNELGEVTSLKNLVFSFSGSEGDVHASSENSRHLFFLRQVSLETLADGSVLLIGEMKMGILAGDLGSPEIMGSHVGTVILQVQQSAIRQKPRRTIVKPGASGGTAAAGGAPDVIVWDIGVDGSDTNDIAYYGQNGGIAAYSIATQSCNSGSATLDWFDSGGDLRHPVIGQNMFRYKDGRFEQLGQSWLKHGFCAVNEFEVGCGPCNGTSCDTLGIGCADTYWATLNDGRSGGSKTRVNATTGAHTDDSPAASGNNTIRGRLQVAVSDMDPAQNAGAEYFIEGHYITADDHQAGQAANNASWRRVVVNSVSNVDGGGNTIREQPAIYAWQDQDPGVTIRQITNTGEPSGLKSYFYLGWRVTALGGNTWRYEYAIQNLNSDQSADSFTVPVPAATTTSGVGFHDVAWHSGDPYDGTDWGSALAGGNLTWATDDFATNVNANALRWGTMYNYYFLADAPPVMGDVTLGLFKPGTQSEAVIANVQVPGTPPERTIDELPILGPFTRP